MKTRLFPLFVILLLLALLAGCSKEDLPSLPQLPDKVPDLSNLPGVPEALRKLPGLVEQLGLPDLSKIANLPKLEDLPILQAPPGGIAYNGPTERQIKVGERVPGTDIVLTAIQDSKAEFQIAGLHSERNLGDSLDFDGGWPGLSGTTYTLRLRIYYISNGYVRAAGVHRLVINNIQPTQTSNAPSGFTLKFPFTASATTGGAISGTTYGYAGSDDRGGKLTGLPQSEYPYRKTGDSIEWTGQIRPDISVAYSLRMLLYSNDRAELGGVVTVALPNQ